MSAPAKPSYEDLQALVSRLREALASAEERIAELERRLGGGSGGGKSTPHFVKANRAPKPEGEQGPRKKRAENHARKLEEPTEVIVHSLESCPDCGRPLPPGWAYRRRQVIDIPKTSYTVREHVMMRHRCGVCGKSYTAQPDLSGETVGRGRVGIQVMSLVAYLRVRCRLPLESIQNLLEVEHGLKLSIGELSGLLDRTSEVGRASYEALRADVQASEVVHADETSWREDGVNGYLWAFVTPTARLFVRSPSRAHTVPLGVLGAEFGGTLVTDFYSGYTPLNCRKQRCWVHLLRDLKALEEEHSEKPAVARWRAAVRALYKRATEYRAKELSSEAPMTMAVMRARAGVRRQFERALLKLARPHLGRAKDPCRRLAERMDRFKWELFAFVEHPWVPPENNAAERAIRPPVVARKVSGGTRSPRGTLTMTILRSLYATWTARGCQPIAACRQMLASTTL